jgi:hypothetical protein
VGLVVSPTIDSSCGEGTSIKLIVHSKNEESPVIFTCDGKAVIKECADSCIIIAVEDVVC